MSNKLSEAAPLIPAMAGLAGRLAAGVAIDAATKKIDQMLSQNHKEEACESCGCEENCEEIGCISCRQKAVQKKRDLGPLENKYNIQMKERAEIVRFLKHLSEKNYAEAHKYLKKVMESKIKSKIAEQKGVKIF